MAESLTPAAARERLLSEYRRTAAALTELHAKLSAKVAARKRRATPTHRKMLRELRRTISWIAQQTAEVEAERIADESASGRPA